jgi:hypothetical protein
MPKVRRNSLPKHEFLRGFENNNSTIPQTTSPIPPITLGFHFRFIMFFLEEVLIPPECGFK